MLGRCAAWVARGQADDLLLESGQLRLLRETHFEQRLCLPGQRQAWFRFLELDRDGERLGKLQGVLDRYLELSKRREQASDAAQLKLRLWAGASLLLLFFVLPALFSICIQGPVTQRAELLLDAGARANRAPLTTADPGVGAGGVPLATLLRAAELGDEARSGESSRMTRLSQWLIEHLSWVPPVQRQGRFLDGLIAQTEPPVNGKLRRLLDGAVWAAAARPPEAAPAEPPRALDVACRPMAGEAGPYGAMGAGIALQGRRYVAQGGNADERRRRALFLPVWTGEFDTTLTLRGATWDAAERRCQYGQIVAAVPLYLDPHLVLDATLRYVAYTNDGPSVQVPSVTVLEIDWDRADDRSRRVLQTQTRAVVSIDAQQPGDFGSALQQVLRAAGSERVAIVPSWCASAGRALGLEGGRVAAAVADGLAPARGRRQPPLCAAGGGQRRVALRAAGSRRRRPGGFLAACLRARRALFLHRTWQPRGRVRRRRARFDPRAGAGGGLRKPARRRCAPAPWRKPARAGGQPGALCAAGGRRPAVAAGRAG